MAPPQWSASPDGEDADILRMRRDLPTLEAVERRRGQLWVVAASASVFLLLADPSAADAIPDSVGIRAGFAGVSLAFLLYVFDQERRLRRLARALVQERILSAALTSRVRDLGTLSRVGQVVNAVLTNDEVLEVVLHGAFELTSSRTGSVMLVDGGELVVAVSAGDGAAPRGCRQPMAAGVAGWVATHHEAVVVTGQLADGQLPDLQRRGRTDGSAVCAPMLVADELVGVLSLERPVDAPPFTEWEMRAVSLFAVHAATAVSNSRRYEQERANVERLAQLVESQGEYVATMVHDLKAPLTAVIGFAKVVSHRPELDEPTRTDLLARIEAAAQQLLQMIQDVLERASTQSDRDVRRDPVDVGALARELADMTAGMAHGRDGVDRPVAVHIDEPGIVLRVDRGALRSILVNLLENAAKYSPPGSPIALQVQRVDGEVRVSVRDEGVGIPEDELASVFERFRQRESDVASHRGVGLGLYIVRSLAQAHGGRVEVTSRVGVGSTFTVVFPDRHAAVPDGPPPLAATSPPTTTVGGPGTG